VTVLPASLLIGIWFLIQLFSGIGSIASVQSGGVAYLAHVGGFVFGLAASRLFENRLRMNA
jgi:membrane associated rhomboid family serine protease